MRLILIFLIFSNSSVFAVLKVNYLEWPKLNDFLISETLQAFSNDLWGDSLEEYFFGLPYYKDTPRHLVMSKKSESLDEVDLAVVSFERCAGISLVNFNRKMYQRALLVSANHCLSDGFKESKVPSINTTYTEKYFSSYNARSTKIVYRSYENDLIIMEIDKSYAEIERMGVQPYELASPDYRVNERVTALIFGSGTRRMGLCSIKGALKSSKLGAKDQIVTDCRGAPGSSGTPLLRLGTREIIGVVHSGTEKKYMLFTHIVKAQQCFNDTNQLRAIMVS